MATSKPEFQGVVLKDSGTNYCGLFKRRVVNTSSTATTQYYWLPCNKSGDIIDYRANIMNGTFSSDTIALSNYPPGYGIYTDNWINEKYLSYMNLYPFDNGDISSYIGGVNDFIKLGANNILVPVLWTDVFKTYSEQQDLNTDHYFAKQDTIIDYLLTKNVKISLMVRLYVDDENTDDFWGTDNTEKDEWGNIVKLGYGNGHPSLAYSTGTNMMKDFFQKVVVYYSNKIGSKLNWITPIITEQDEYGYNFQYISDIHKLALYGYSQHTIAGFRAWLPTQYANPTAMNNAWGSTYGSFDDAYPPTSGKAPGTASVSELNALFASPRGVDFYRYRFKLIYDFANDCRQIVETNSSAKFVLCFGGVSPNDALVPLRGSYDVIKWGEISDGLKTAFASDKRNPITSMTLDFLQNYPNKLMTELHHIDYYGSSENPLPIADVKANMIQSAKDAIANGAKDVLFIGMPKQGDWFTMLKQICAEIKPGFFQNTDGGRTTNGIINISLGELLYSGGQLGITKWQNEGGRDDKRIKIIFSNDIDSGGDPNYPLTIQLKNNQRYYL